MARPTSLGAKIVKDYLRQYPNTPSLTLAKKIYESKDGKAVFTSLELVRSHIRRLRGTRGEYHREKLSSKEFVHPIAKNFGIPDGEREDMSAFIIPKNIKRALVINDVHVPYHDAEALTKALQYGLDYSADCIIINGDFLDFYKISKYESDPRARSLKYEIETGRLILEKIRAIFPDVPIYFKMGNHEMRWESYLKIKAPELLDMEEFRLDVIMHFGKHRITNVTGLRPISFGKLDIWHGHEFKGGGEFVAKSYLLKVGTNILFGHHHRKDEFYMNSKGGHIKAYCVGHLGEKHPAYMPINRWTHGFAFVTIDNEQGDFTVTNKAI